MKTCHSDKLEYRHRLTMNGTSFFVEGIKYKIVEGTWVVKDHEVLDAIKFENINTGEQFVMPEKEFFSKVNI